MVADRTPRTTWPPAKSRPNSRSSAGPKAISVRSIGQLIATSQQVAVW
jgi:hypothetical protein